MSRSDPLLSRIGATVIALPLAALFMTPLIAGLALYNGWALSVAWGWVAVPLFGAPPLSISQCIAVAATIGMFKTADTSKGETDNGKVLGAVLAPLLGLAIIWIAMQFWPVQA